ncbi:MAG: hypothetical protein ACO1OB_26465 [Archangium sp.]
MATSRTTHPEQQPRTKQEAQSKPPHKQEADKKKKAKTPRTAKPKR